MSRPTTASVLAVLATLMVAGLLLALLLRPIPEANRDLVLQLGALVVGGWGGAMAFYFGSSKGGRDALASLAEDRVARAEASAGPAPPRQDPVPFQRYRGRADDV